MWGFHELSLDGRQSVCRPSREHNPSHLEDDREENTQGSTNTVGNGWVDEFRGPLKI